RVASSEEAGSHHVTDNRALTRRSQEQALALADEVPRYGGTRTSAFRIFVRFRSDYLEFAGSPGPVPLAVELADGLAVELAGAVDVDLADGKACSLRFLISSCRLSNSSVVLGAPAKNARSSFSAIAVLVVCG